MKLYRGIRTDQGCKVQVSLSHVRVFWTDLRPCNHIRNHSPDGCNWGYQGSGPAQLALALAVDLLGLAGADPDVYQTLKRDLVAKIENDNWTLTEEEVRAYLPAHPENMIF